jgi:hypothetical protein
MIATHGNSRHLFPRAADIQCDRRVGDLAQHRRVTAVVEKENVPVKFLDAIKFYCRALVQLAAHDAFDRFGS